MIVKLVFGLFLLIAGAELLVRHASKLAIAFGVSPLVVGLTIVGFGTSSPELVVSASSAIHGQSSIAVANVIGSNILNILLILGLSAAITPLTVSRQLMRVEVPLMIAVSIAVLLLSLNGNLSRTEGIVLVLGLLIYTGAQFIFSKYDDCSLEEIEKQSMSMKAITTSLVLILVGLGCLVIGSNLLVNGAIAIARWMDVSETIIGLTIIAAGTSLPEIVTSIVASLKGQRDLAVGNIIGSNMFNMLGVLGVSAIASSTGGLEILPSVLHFDFPIMLTTCFICLPIFFTGALVNRWEGLLFVGLYIGYTTYLILKATQHDAINSFTSVMLYFVLPIVAGGVFLSVISQLRTSDK